MLDIKKQSIELCQSQISEHIQNCTGSSIDFKLAGSVQGEASQFEIVDAQKQQPILDSKW